MEPPICFAWLGLCALTWWLTAGQMPPGFGDAMKTAQLVGGGISALLVTMGLPSAINPGRVVGGTARLDGSRRGGTTWSRQRGLVLTGAGVTVFVVASLVGYQIERGAGLPSSSTPRPPVPAERPDQDASPIPPASPSPAFGSAAAPPSGSPAVPASRS